MSGRAGPAAAGGLHQFHYPQRAGHGDAAVRQEHGAGGPAAAGELGVEAGRQGAAGERGKLRADGAAGKRRVRAGADGADRGVLVTDRVLGGADTWATSTTIAGALRKLDYDLIITGRQAIDGDTAQVGPQIAEHLGIPVISYAQEIKVDGDAVIVKRQYDDGYHMLKAKMPCLVTALSELNEPRYMTPGGIFDAVNAEITTLGRADLVDVDDSNIGLKGSPTKIAKASDKVRKGAGEKVVPDSPDEAVSYIVGKLKDKHVI